MTIAEISAQMGVAPETLVQEVIARESVKFQWLVILGALAIGLSIFILLACVICNSEGVPVFGLYTACGLIFVGVMLLTNVIDWITWKTAPETTANQYIVEHYGGVQND